MKYILDKSAVLSFVALKVIVFCALVFVITGCRDNPEKNYVLSVTEIICDNGMTAHSSEGLRLCMSIYQPPELVDSLFDALRLGGTYHKGEEQLEILVLLQNMDIPDKHYFNAHMRLENAINTWASKAKTVNDYATVARNEFKSYNFPQMWIKGDRMSDFLICSDAYPGNPEGMEILLQLKQDNDFSRYL